MALGLDTIGPIQVIQFPKSIAFSRVQAPLICLQVLLDPLVEHCIGRISLGSFNRSEEGEGHFTDGVVADVLLLELRTEAGNVVVLLGPLEDEVVSGSGFFGLGIINMIDSTFPSCMIDRTFIDCVRLYLFFYNIYALYCGVCDCRWIDDV